MDRRCPREHPGIQFQGPPQSSRSGRPGLSRLRGRLRDPRRAGESLRARSGPVLPHAPGASLIIPAFGFNLAGDLLARVVCYDESGEPFVADTTRATTNFTPSGGGLLLDRVELPEACFAPIVLIGGSVGPGGERPSSWFASSGF